MGSTSLDSLLGFIHSGEVLSAGLEPWQAKWGGSLDICSCPPHPSHTGGGPLLESPEPDLWVL